MINLFIFGSLLISFALGSCFLLAAEKTTGGKLFALAITALDMTALWAVLGMT